MITGVDNVIFTASKPHEILSALVPSIRRIWPRFRLLMGERSFSPARLPRATDFAKAYGEILFVRDKQMFNDYDRRGFHITRRGDGPFGIVYELRNGIDYSLERVIESIRKPGDPLPPDPYPARLCSRKLFGIDVVTPGLLSDSPFCRQIYEMVCKACVGESV